MLDDGKHVVACLGASITEAKGSFDWIAELAARPGNDRFTFRNHGVGGDLAYCALRRLPTVVADRPDVVVVALGWNDVTAQVFANVRRFMAWWKRLPQEPTPEWYRESLHAIVRGVRANTGARVGLCSPSEMGERPDSAHVVQRRLNELFAEYATIVSEVADEEGAAYLPFYERLHARIEQDPGPEFTAFSFPSFYRDAFAHLALRRSLDDIGAAHGWRFHVDGLHLNGRGGRVLADVVQEFLDTVSGPA